MVTKFFGTPTKVISSGNGMGITLTTDKEHSKGIEKKPNKNEGVRKKFPDNEIVINDDSDSEILQILNLKLR